MKCSNCGEVYYDGHVCKRHSDSDLPTTNTKIPMPEVKEPKKNITSLTVECKADTKELDEAIKKAEYLVGLLERIETQTQHWNEHVLSEYMKIKI
ncbi:MAG: hypothetical protein RR090_12865 [Niameybacter sp.]